jgi:hypothetical protein
MFTSSQPLMESLWNLPSFLADPFFWQDGNQCWQKCIPMPHTYVKNEFWFTRIVKPGISH